MPLALPGRYPDIEKCVMAGEAPMTVPLFYLVGLDYWNLAWTDFPGGIIAE